MQVLSTAIPGCFKIVPQVRRDDRGSFVKTFREDIFQEHGLTTRFAEEYYTSSHQGVLRGLHFQVPPKDHVKVVTCLSGKVMDAVVDLRTGSPAYGRHLVFELSADNGNILYLPPGLAHGFYVPNGEALLSYKVTSLYSPEHDSGILWDSADILWPDKSPHVSARDRSFARLDDFKSPFLYSSPL